VATHSSHIKYTITNSSDLSSNQTPMLLTLNGIPTILKNYPTITTSKINQKKFSQIIENRITLNSLLKTLLNFDTVVQSFSTIIQNAALNASQNNPSTTYPTNVLPSHMIGFSTKY